MNDELGDRMKSYESAEAGRRLMPLLPVIARIDGRAFHTFTKGLERPYDPKFSHCMVETTRHLMKETNACMGYTQSDEITLAWHSTDIRSQIWFDGRVSKMTSQLAAHATLAFFQEVAAYLPYFMSRNPTFDARVWNVPNRTEGANVFVWREWDATKNSISMAASSMFSDADLHGKNGSDKQEMMWQKGVNWDDYPVAFKRGTYLQRRKTAQLFSAEEIESLPPQHAARKNPNLMVERSQIEVIEMPIITSVINREDVIFAGSFPETDKSNVVIAANHGIPL